MVFRAAVTCLSVMLGLPAAAQCVGESYLDQLTPQRQAELTNAVASMPFAEGLVWTATQETTTLTIVGTMHIYDPRLEEIRAKVSQAVAQSDLVLLEATPEEEAQLQELMVTDPGRIFIVDGPTLPDLLDETTWRLIADAANDRGIPGFMAAQMQPWYLSLLLAIPNCAMADMVAGARGLDHMISDDATAAGIPLQALEPYTTLFDIFQSDSIEEQVDMLRLNLFAPELQQQMFVAMLDRYFAEDVGRLWEMSRLAMSDIPELTASESSAMFNEMQVALLDQRNRNWIPVIEDAAKSHDAVVVAVGAAHLIGDQGILQLLEDTGWTVTRVP